MAEENTKISTAKKDGLSEGHLNAETTKNSKRAKNDKPSEKSGGFCVYLGPSIHGVILNGTVYDSDKEKTLTEIESVVKTYPLVANLIVPGSLLPECRQKVKTPGNLLYVNYNKLAGKLKTK